MKPIARNLFSQNDLESIQAAVHSAEGQTSGEVVPYVVFQSDDYDEAELGGALAFSLIPPVVYFCIQLFTDIWMLWEAPEMVLAIFAFMALGWILTGKLAPLKRFFAGKNLLSRRVEQRAEEAFLAEEIFKTRDRTGILLFVSVLEHRVLVLGDSGINARVRKEDWDVIVRHVVTGIKSGRKADAMIEAIRMCGDLLQNNGLPLKPGDTNELSNELRTG